jgi:hypothetical protein
MTASNHRDLISVKLAMAKLEQAATGFFPRNAQRSGLLDFAEANSKRTL